MGGPRLCTLTPEELAARKLRRAALMKEYHRAHREKLKKERPEVLAERQKLDRAKYPERWRKYMQDYHVRNLSKRRETSKRYQQRRQTWREGKYKLLAQARRAVYEAIRRGELVRKPCQCCGSQDVQAHHASYYPAEWLKVIWLCRVHHKAWHKLFLPEMPDLSIEA